MAPKNIRGRQATIDLLDSEESGGEIGGELVLTIGNIAELPAYFPGLSYESSNSLTQQINAIINVRDAGMQEKIDV